MSWVRADDQFASHVKVLRLLRDPQGVTALGLWILCLTWSHGHTRDLPPAAQGTVPPEVVDAYTGDDGPALAALLVKVGLWEHAGEGWRFHDFREWQNSAAREEMSRAGKRGAAARWGNAPSLFDDPDGDPNGVALGTSSDPNASHPIPSHPQPISKPKTASKPARPVDPAEEQARQVTKIVYDAAKGLIKFPAVKAIVKRALAAGEWDADEVQEALLQLVADGRPITFETVRSRLLQARPRSQW